MTFLAEVESGSSSGVGGVVGGLVGALFSAWLASRMRNTKAEILGGNSTLLYHKAYLALGWITFGLFATAAVASQFSEENGRVKVMCLGIFGGFALLGLMLVTMYYRCRISWHDETLQCSRLFGAPFHFTWKDVMRVKFSAVAQWWILFLQDGRKVRVSTYMAGAVDFMRQIKERSEVFVPPGVLTSGEKIDFS